jgi:hypothetical protein
MNMSIITVTYDFSEIDKEFRKSSYSRSTKLLEDVLSGKVCGRKRSTGYITKVLDSGARFINLFGLFVDSNSGDIALGLFPNPNDYISIGNIYDLIAEHMFGSKEIPDHVDKKFLLESLKLNVAGCIMDIDTEVYKTEEYVPEFDSVILNLANQLKHQRLCKSFDGYDKNRDTCICTIIKTCADILNSIVKASRSFFGAFIEESNVKEIGTNSLINSDLHNILDSGKPNLEVLTDKYIMMGVSPDLLFALKSYGYGIKQRSLIVDSIVKLSYRDGLDNKKDIYSLGDKLSSMSYLSTKATAINGVDTIFNILDMLRAVGWDNSLFFSLEMIQSEKNRFIYDSVVKKFCIKDIIKESGIKESDFVKGILEYKESVLPVISYGYMYTRKPGNVGYCLSTHSIRQLISAGNVFNMVGELVSGKFKTVGGQE